MAHNGKLVVNKVDVLTLAEEVNRDCKLGRLSHELLEDGQTLFGISMDYPDYLERITPAGNKSLGRWEDGEFKELLCPLSF